MSKKIYYVSEQGKMKSCFSKQKMAAIIKLFAEAGKKLECNIGNTQCGGKCQPSSYNCTDEKSEETSNKLDRFTNIIIPEEIDSDRVYSDLPKAYIESIDGYAEKLGVALTDHGMTITDKEIKAKSKALQKYAEQLGEEKFGQYIKATLSLMNLTGGRQLSSTLNGAEVEKLKDPDIQKKLLDGYENPNLLIGGKYTTEQGADGKYHAKFTAFKEGDKEYGKAVISYNDEEMPMLADDEFIKFFIEMAPKSFKDSLNRAGKPAGRAFAGYDEKGNRKNEGDGNNDDRKIVLARQFIRQQNQSAYTGLPLTFANADLEHINPIGKNGNDAEDPNNYVWTSKSENQTKKENDMSYLFDGGSAGDKSSDSFPGVAKIQDAEEWHKEKYLTAEKNAADRLANREQMNEGSEELVKAFAGNLEAKANAIGIYKAMNKSGKELEVAAQIFSNDIIAKHGLEMQGFRRRIVWKNEETGEKDRNESTYPGTTNVEMNFGNVKKSEPKQKLNKKTGEMENVKKKNKETGEMEDVKTPMKLSEWMLWNFTSMSLEGQKEMMLAYENVLQEFASSKTNPNKAITIGKWVQDKMPAALQAVYDKHCPPKQCLPKP